MLDFDCLEFSMSANSPSSIVRFGTFEVNFQTGELRQRGQKVKLQEQPLQVLAALLERPGEMVTREELHSKLWPEDTFVDFDHSLNAAVARLRDALGESADRPVFIETLARRGYRFNSPLLAAPGASPASGEQRAGSPSASGSSPFSKARIAAIAALTAAVLAASALTWARFSHRPLAAPRISSIAVLPLENLSHDPEQEYFSEGMTSAIIGDVSKLRPLRVISRTSTERYKGTRKSLPEIAKELNVDAVIEGSVLRAGNQVRIDVELVQASNEQQLWSESYQRELGDVLRLHSELAQAIAGKVQIQLAAAQAAKFRAAPWVDQGAYEDYLKARFYWMTAGPDSQILMAQQFYQKSIKEDPSFALPYAGLAQSYLILGTLRRLSPQEAAQNGQRFAEKALQLDPTLGEAHASLALLSWQYRWNWPQAEAEYRRAIEANSSYLEGHESFAWFLSWSGRRDETLAEIALMRYLDPAFPSRCNDEALLYYHLREYPALVEAARKGVDLYPRQWTSHYFLGVGDYNLGKKAEAIGEFQRAVDMSEGDQDTLAALAFADASVGKRDAAQKILVGIQRGPVGTHVSPYMLAVIWAGLGDKTKAFAFLEKAYAERSTDLAYFIKADFRLDSLRSDPRFQDLQRRVAPPNVTP
jgi:TolB-like protein/DNA-binding winged helix-turn-helix (wHTH) protein